MCSHHHIKVLKVEVKPRRTFPQHQRLCRVASGIVIMCTCIRPPLRRLCAQYYLREAKSPWLLPGFNHVALRPCVVDEPAQQTHLHNSVYVVAVIRVVLSDNRSAV